MSDLATQLLDSSNKLSAERFQDWKQKCINKALGFDAYDILTQEETEPTLSTTPTSEELRALRDFRSRKSKIAGYIRDTLDAGHLALIANIPANDAPGIWDILLAHFESKDTNSRLVAMQELLALRMRDAGHESENFSTYGARCVSASNRLRNLLPEGASMSAAVASANGTIATPAILNPGFTATNLVNELAIGMIIIGLGSTPEERQLKHTLTHKTISTVEDIMVELQKADNLVRSDNIAAGSTTTEALAAKVRGKPKSDIMFICSIHGKNRSHKTDDCNVVRRQKKEATDAKFKKVEVARKGKERQRANAADDEDESSEEEAVAMAQVAHMASPPRRRQSSIDSADTTWNPDSGATSHMTPHREWIRDMVPCNVGVRLANNDVVWATGRGSVVFNPSINGKPAESVVFSRVLYVPDLQNNLFSVLSAVRHGKLKVVIEHDQLVFSKDDNVMFTGSIRRNTGTLDGTTLSNNEHAFVARVSRSLLHQRLGHIGKDRLNVLVRKQLADGVIVETNTDVPDFCEHCIAGKQHRDPFPHSSEHRSHELLGRIHSDLHGKLPRTLSGFQYWVTFIDDFSRFKRVYLLKKKSETFVAFQQYVAEAERQLGVKVKELRDDKGGEYMSNEFKDWCKDHGIKRQRTTKATPSQNGVAERLNRTLAEGAIAMLNQAKLPEGFWGQAVVYLANILNATPSSALSDTTSFEVWNRRKPDLSAYRTFGCRAFVHIQKKERTAFGSHTRPCVFIGFEDGFKGWKVYDPKAKKVIISRDVIFDETTFPGLSTKDVDAQQQPIGISELWPYSTDSTDEDKDDGDMNDEAPPNPPEVPPQNHPGPPEHGPDPDLRPPTPPAGTPSNTSDGFSSDWEDDKNITGQPRTVVTPPRPPHEDPFTPQKQEDPGPSRQHAQRQGIRAESPQSPSTPSYAEALRSPPPPVQQPPPIRIPALNLNTPASRADRQAPLPAQGTRPIRQGRVQDYYTLQGMRRRGTAPVPRRQVVQVEDEEIEGRDVVIGNRNAAEDVRQGGANEQMADRGGERMGQRPPSVEPPPVEQQIESPVAAQAPAPADSSDSDEASIDNALKTTSIIESVNFVYDICDEYVSWIDGYGIACDLAIEKAFGAAVRPKDAPRSFKEAMSSPDHEKWMEAAQIEIDALIANGTWELVKLPDNRKAIGSRWVFLVKRKADGSIDRYKARLVAQGCGQRPGIDFDQVFAPTARLAALRTILVQAALAGEHIESIDISNAYLNGELEKEYEVYMRQPEGFEKDGPNGEHWVCRLVKGLYGLKQSGRLWYHKLGKTLAKLGFTQIKSGPSIYIWETEGVRVILPVFVDDVTIVSRSKRKIVSIKERLGQEFKIKDLGPTSYLLGIKIDYDRPNRCLQLSQRQYILDMLARFNLTDCKPVATPMEPGIQLSKALCPSTSQETEEMRRVPYMNAVGALMYLAIGTRPDIAYAVGKLAQFNTNPGPRHWKAAQHLFRYLKGTLDLKLTYRRDESTISSEAFVAYSDADHAGCIDTRRSTTGYVIKMGTGVVSWSSKKQAVVALSSTEAEYIAAVTAGQEILWMRELMQELHFDVGAPSRLMMDNQSAMATIQNPEHHGRMKHVEIRHHWIRDEVRRKTIEVQYIPTEQMTADILTKALPRVLVERHRLALGVM